MGAANENAAARKARQRAAEKTNHDNQPDEAPAQVQPNGILLIKERTEDGGIRIVPQTLGDVQITEMQTILEIGIRTVRQQLGLDSAK